MIGGFNTTPFRVVVRVEIRAFGLRVVGFRERRD